MYIILYTKDENALNEFVTTIKEKYMVELDPTNINWKYAIDRTDITTSYDLSDLPITYDDIKSIIHCQFMLVESRDYVKITQVFINSTEVDKTTIQADGIDTVTFSNAPVGTITIKNSEEVSGTIEGTDTFATTIAGTYNITIICDGYEDFTTTIEAI